MTTQDKLNAINDTINNSSNSYMSRNEEEVLQDMKDNRERLLNGTQEVFEDSLEDIEEFYSSYIPEASLTREELGLQYGDAFQIGNNIKGGI